VGRPGARVHTLAAALTRSGAEPARRTIFLAAIALLVSLGLAAAFRSYAGPDTGFLLDEAARVLAGARLYVDLVDVNPPLILFLNMAAVMFARRFGLSEILAYRLGCTVVLLAMLLLAAWLLRRLLPEEIVLRRAIILILAFTLFNLAGQDFGEREHLLLALIVPYLLVGAARAVGREIPTAEALLIGLLAAGAFALKPHFVLVWLAVEGYLRLTRRVSWGTVLPETATIAVALALYTGAIIVWAPGYLQLVRLLAGPYTRFLYVSFWQLLVTGPGALLTLFAILAFAALRRYARHPEIPGVFALGALVCLVAGAAQQKEFSYHFYPSIALATLVLGTIVWDRRESLRNWVGRLYRVIVVSVLVTVVVVVCVRNAASTIRPPRDPEQEQMERLLPVVRARATGEGVYVMSYNISSAYPMINYAGAHSASRFAQLWILAAAYMDQLRGSRPLRYHAPDEMSPSERYLNQAVLEDLRNQRPKLLIILQHARDLPANGLRRLDYVAYFSRDPRTASMLQRYQSVADLGDFVIYERIADGMTRTGRPPSVQPGTRDIVQARQTGGAYGVHARVNDPAFLLPLLVFVISAIFASISESSRGSAQVGEDRRDPEPPLGVRQGAASPTSHASGAP
jgi:hypothetical protein